MFSGTCHNAVKDRSQCWDGPVEMVAGTGHDIVRIR